MEPLSQAELAQSAAENVAAVASDLLEKYLPMILSRRELIFNLSKLASFLMFVSLDQGKYEQGEYQGQQDSVHRLEQLLGLLEMICTVCSPIYPHMVDLSTN